MKPFIGSTEFGSIMVDDNLYEHDIIIRIDGSIEKRKKKLSKAIFGTSHKVSLDEAKYIYQPGASQVIVGTGQYGALEFSEEARDYIEKQKCDLVMKNTRKAIVAYNQAEDKVVGMFHVTC